MKIYREVKCSDRLPKFKEKGQIIFFFNKANRKSIGFMQNEYEVATDYNEWEDLRKMNTWLEPIEVELDSEKILPIEDRVYDELKQRELNHRSKLCEGTVTLYHKALEVAEMKNVQLQQMYNSVKEVSDRRKEQVDLLTSNADERFNKALEYIDSIFSDKTDNHDVFHILDDKGDIKYDVMKKEYVVTASKLAAYGTDK